MSEEMEKVRGIQELPIFPLPLVMLPWEFVQLHIFEQKYRSMLADILEDKRMFGISYFDPTEGLDNRPEPGSIGCVAEVKEVQELPDGRSNILTVGVIRYRILDYLATDNEYLVADVGFFEDEEDSSEETLELANALFTTFREIADTAQEMSGRKSEPAEFPMAPPDQLSFLIAAAFNLDVEEKRKLLAMTSIRDRLSFMESILEKVQTRIRETAKVNKISRTNGHAKKKIDIE
ncbi:MAG: LON peptidase substrate-binding domain-containing protein [Pyrinomonadaceae bacterium]